MGTEAWANVNSFLALIAIRGSIGDPLVEGLLRLGARLLRQTLELPLPNHRLEQNLPAAITWILNAGRMMYTNPGIEVKSRGVGREVEVEMYWGPDTLNSERWQASTAFCFMSLHLMAIFRRYYIFYFSSDTNSKIVLGSEVA